MRGVGQRKHYKAPLPGWFGFLVVLTVSGFIAYACQAWIDLRNETTDRLSLIRQLQNRITNEVFEHRSSMLYARLRAILLRYISCRELLIHTPQPVVALARHG